MHPPSTGLVLCSNVPFDVVLVDYDLDDGKGDDLVRELMSRVTRPEIIGISARPEGNAALRAAGADAVCSKLRFSEVIQHLVEQER